MKVIPLRWSEAQGWEAPFPDARDRVDLALVFGSRRHFETSVPFEALRVLAPEARLLGCSTAGEIAGGAVLDDALCGVAVSFEATRVATALVEVGEGDAAEAGRKLAAALAGEDLAHVLVLSDGLRVNGSALASGLAEILPAGVVATGGLAADADLFRETRVAFGTKPRTRAVVGLGLYGKRLRVGCGSRGGWDPFGPERLVTASQGAVVRQMDGEPALDLYKLYLGRHAEGLPAAGLRFPLSIRRPGSERRLVRTILAVNEAEGSLTFAGDVPEGAYARLMKANFHRLADGAAQAAEDCLAAGERSPDLAVLISCVGRKMALKQLAEEEIDAVAGVFGPKTVLTGFYSYGEIAPAAPGLPGELHNQTMTITALSEE